MDKTSISETNNQPDVKVALEDDTVSSTTVLRKGPVLFGLEEKSCQARERRRPYAREREREKDLKKKRREKRNKHLVLVVREMGVLVFKQ